MSEDTITIEIKKRPWWAWVLAALWLLVEIFMLQTAVASMWEFESQAALISWIIFLVLLVGGVIVWIRTKK